MKQGKEEWTLGLNKNRFNWGETYHSKEEAIDVGRKRLRNNPAFVCFYVGRLIRPEPKADIDNIIEDLVSNAVYIYDEYYNDFLEDVTDKQREELEHDIDKVIQNWLDKHNLRDYGYLIDDVERVKA